MSCVMIMVLSYQLGQYVIFSIVSDSPIHPFLGVIFPTFLLFFFQFQCRAVLFIYITFLQEDLKWG